MQRLEGLASAGGKDRDKIDRDVCPLQRSHDGIRIAQIRLDRMNLADGTHGLQVAGEVRSADGGANTGAAFRQGAHGVAANEA